MMADSTTNVADTQGTYMYTATEEVTSSTAVNHLTSTSITSTTVTDTVMSSTTSYDYYSTSDPITSSAAAHHTHVLSTDSSDYSSATVFDTTLLISSVFLITESIGEILILFSYCYVNCITIFALDTSYH